MQKVGINTWGLYFPSVSITEFLGIDSSLRIGVGSYFGVSTSSSNNLGAPSMPKRASSWGMRSSSSSGSSLMEARSDRELVPGVSSVFLQLFSWSSSAILDENPARELRESERLI